MVFRNCFGMIMSVSTFLIGRGAATPRSVVNFCIAITLWERPSGQGPEGGPAGAAQGGVFSARALVIQIESASALGLLVFRIFCGEPASTSPENASGPADDQGFGQHVMQPLLAGGEGHHDEPDQKNDQRKELGEKAAGGLRETD